MCGNNGFITLHIGAGYHSVSKEKIYKNLVKKACVLGNKLLKEGQNALQAAEIVCCYLEGNDMTNAGYGSNLTFDGTVECDAGVMESTTGLFVGVGCLQGVKNPIKLSTSLLMQQKEKEDMNLVPPIMIVGEGAKQKAEAFNLELVGETGLVTSKSIRDFQRFKRAIAEDQGESVLSKKRSVVDDDSLQDTIGVICVDSFGCIATAVSSGGIVLKQPGRIGHAAHFGCGCWSFSYSSNITIGCCTSGTGEYLIRTHLAKQCADYLFNCPDDEIVDLNSFLKMSFLHSPYLKNNFHPKYCGLVMIKLEKDVERMEQTVDLYVAHTSPSFCYGHMSSHMTHPRVAISRIDEQSCSVFTQTWHHKL